MTATTSLARRATPAGPGPRRRLRWLLLVAVVLAAAGATAGLTLTGDSSPRAAGVVDPTNLVPTIAAVDGTEAVPRRLEPAPAAGTLTRLPGPFDEGSVLAGLRLELGSSPAVTGTVEVLNEVSEVIVLELQVAWYDQAGQLLDINRLTLHQEEFTAAFEAGAIPDEHNGPLPFRLAAPAGVASQVSSAAIGLPSLVNE